MTAAPTERPRLGEAALGRLGLEPGSAGPRGLWIGSTAVFCALAVMFGFLYSATRDAQAALDAIGHDSGQQVIATAKLYRVLSEADTEVATALLLGEGRPGEIAAALAEHGRLRENVDDELLAAQHLAGPDERETIQSIAIGFGQYTQFAVQALDAADAAAYPAGDTPGDILDGYRPASELMAGLLLPQAYNLALENSTIVREDYDLVAGRIAFTAIPVAVFAAAGLLALLSLVSLQIHLARTYRRTYNPSLLLATAVTGLYLFTGLSVLHAEQQALETAKTDGFDTALSLSRASAISSSLHADQVRYLLDPEQAAVYEHAYFDKAQQLVYLEVVSLGDYQDLIGGPGGELAGSGLIGAVLPDIEEQAGLADGYAALIEADAKMRASDAPAAERLAYVDDARTGYRAALTTALTEREGLFNDAIRDGERAIADFGFLLPAAMASVIALTYVGITPRVREFR